MNLSEIFMNLPVSLCDKIETYDDRYWKQKRIEGASRCSMTLIMPEMYELVNERLRNERLDLVRLNGLKREALKELYHLRWYVTGYSSFTWDEKMEPHISKYILELIKNVKDPIWFKENMEIKY